MPFQVEYIFKRFRGHLNLSFRSQKSNSLEPDNSKTKLVYELNLILIKNEKTCKIQIRVNFTQAVPLYANHALYT